MKKRKKIDITTEEFIDMICERCHVGRSVERGVMDAEQAEPICDTCIAAIIACDICEKAGIK